MPAWHVVGAVAAGLERVDADRLFPGEAGGRRDLGVGALELELALRPVRHEAVLRGRGLEEIRNARDRRAPAAPARAAAAIAGRPRRSGIDRRLGQHIVVRARSARCCGAWRCGRAASRRSIANRPRLRPHRPGGPGYRLRSQHGDWPRRHLRGRLVAVSAYLGKRRQRRDAQRHGEQPSKFVALKRRNHVCAIAGGNS